MKALVADFSLGREVWGRLKSRVFSREVNGQALGLELKDFPEPALPSQRWVKVRTIMSGISDLDEGLFFHRNLGPFGGFLTFPLVPGNENLGIVTEVGADVTGVEPGERVVLDPVLSCGPREIRPPCPSCRYGEPSACANFGAGIVGPGTMIGACTDTGGGWSAVFVAHGHQVRPVPPAMESPRALLVPEFTRAVRAVLSHPPQPGSRVIIMGARSLGLLTFLALALLGHQAEILVVAEHPHEAGAARGLGPVNVMVSEGPGTACEQIAEFVGGSVHYPRIGRVALRGGADLVYETTGTRDGIDDAMRFTGEGKDIVLMGINQSSGFDVSPVWNKGIKIHGTSFSGTESYNGEVIETIDLALSLIAEAPPSICELVTHTYPLHEHAHAWTALKDRGASKAIKVIFSQVM